MNISTLYGLAIILLDICPTEMYTYAYQKPYMSRSIAALFIIALN